MFAQLQMLNRIFSECSVGSQGAKLCHAYTVDWDQTVFQLIWVLDGCKCHFMTLIHKHNKTNKMTCVPSKDSEQSGHPPSLISAQAGPSLWWVHRSFCWFYSAIAHFILNIFGSSTMLSTVMIISFWIDRSGQTVKTQTRLLLEEKSDQGLHCLSFYVYRRSLIRVYNVLAFRLYLSKTLLNCKTQLNFRAAPLAEW